MTTYPDAIVKNIPPGTNDPKIVPVGIVWHVRAGRGDSLYDVFRNRGGIESHLYIRYDGTIEQYRDFEYEADAQSAGNSWITAGVRYGLISVETEGICGEEWTPAQMASMFDISRWVIKQYRVPRRVCPSPTSSGFGYHALFNAWNEQAHACPCTERIRQFRDVFVPWLSAGAQEDDDMTPEQTENIVFDVLTKRPFTTNSEQDPDLDNRSVGGLILVAARSGERTREDLAKLTAKVDRLTALVTTLIEGNK